MPLQQLAQKFVDTKDINEDMLELFLELQRQGFSFLGISSLDDDDLYDDKYSYYRKSINTQYTQNNMGKIQALQKMFGPRPEFDYFHTFLVKEYEKFFNHHPASIIDDGCDLFPEIKEKYAKIYMNSDFLNNVDNTDTKTIKMFEYATLMQDLSNYSENLLHDPQSHKEIIAFWMQNKHNIIKLHSKNSESSSDYYYTDKNVLSYFQNKAAHNLFQFFVLHPEQHKKLCEYMPPFYSFIDYFKKIEESEKYHLQFTDNHLQHLIALRPTANYHLYINKMFSFTNYGIYSTDSRFEHLNNMLNKNIHWDTLFTINYPAKQYLNLSDLLQDLPNQLNKAAPGYNAYVQQIEQLIVLHNYHDLQQSLPITTITKKRVKI